MHAEGGDALDVHYVDGAIIAGQRHSTYLGSVLADDWDSYDWRLALCCGNLWEKWIAKSISKVTKC